MLRLSSRFPQNGLKKSCLKYGRSSPKADALDRRGWFIASAERFQSSLPVGDEDELHPASAARIVEAYRRYGHFHADLDPLDLVQRPPRPELAPAQYLSHGESAERLLDELSAAYCGKIGAEFEHLDSAQERQWWAEAMETLGGDPRRAGVLTPAERRNAAMLMLQADALEQFLARRFPGFKRYSGEGAEAMQPAVHAILAAAAATTTNNANANGHGLFGGFGCYEGTAASAAVISMPHRGRLALLASQLEYPLRRLFWKVRGNSEFPESMPELVDDVTSHLAASLEKRYDGDARLRVSLLHNPSHLEIGGAVAAGKARAKAAAGGRVLPLVMHGDAAVAGQGCVAEALAMAGLPGFDVGGTVHLVVNNQIGFTTQPREGRSGPYCTDVAKAGGAPVLHVNGGDGDAVLAAAKLATAYWRRFGRDVFIDLVTYRRHGHNEVDEPSFTQPKMYQAVRGRHDGSGSGSGSSGGGGSGGGVPVEYAAQLQAEGLLAPGRADGWSARFGKHLEAELAASEKLDLSAEPADAFKDKWAGVHHPTAAECHARLATGAPAAALTEAALASVTVPPGFQVHSRLMRSHVEARKRQVEAGVVDWATAEAMAFGTLLAEGDSVRLVGQDVGRGTFSQRHARLICQASEEELFPLAQWEGAKGRLEVVNSHLSELAVLGFEFGHSWEDPRTLGIWEAQFGDFANCAQMIIDQYISGTEAKWLRQSGLTLLLPHGMDGAGPEHSSGRPERFLQLVDDPGVAPVAVPAGGDASASATEAAGTAQSLGERPFVNMWVCHPSTPANYFHLLRRQQRRSFRKPLVVLVPKVLLRLPEALSLLADMTEGTAFEPVLPDPAFSSPSGPSSGADAAGTANKNADVVRRVIVCSGKLFYDLQKRRAAQIAGATASETAGGFAAGETAILRLEQLAPFPAPELAAELGRFPNAKEVIWAQEEPLNAGALAFVYPQIQRIIGLERRLTCVSRPVLPTPAVGLGKRNAAQAEEILKQCLP